MWILYHDISWYEIHIITNLHDISWYIFHYVSLQFHTFHEFSKILFNFFFRRSCSITNHNMIYHDNKQGVIYYMMIYNSFHNKYCLTWEKTNKIIHTIYYININLDISQIIKIFIISIMIYHDKFFDEYHNNHL